MAKQELFQNNTVDALNGGVDGSQTTITVDDGSLFPATGDFRILIDSEIMLVTAVATDDLTVVRGAEGTAATSHSDDAVVTMLLTAGGLNQGLANAGRHYGYSPPFGRIEDANGDMMLTTDMTWLNQGSASATDNANGSITLHGVTDATSNIRGLYTGVPGSTPWSAILCIEHWGRQGGAGNQPYFGIFRRENSSSKIYTFAFKKGNQVSPLVTVTRYSSVNTSPAATPYDSNYIWMANRLWWFKLEDDGTDLNFSLSMDGVNWFEVHSESRATYFSSAPDQVGFFVNSDGNQSSPLPMLVHHFSFE